MVNPASQAKKAGLTPRSLVAAITAMVLAGIYTQLAEVIYVMGAPAEQVLPLPAISTILLLLCLCGISFGVFKFRLLNRNELFCVMFSLLIAVPVMSQGMWHRFIGILSDTPKQENFAYIDAFSDKLWPHGPNLFKDRFQADQLKTQQQEQLTWKNTPVEENLELNIPVIQHQQPNSESYLQFKLDDFEAQKPYLLTVLATCEETGPETRIFARYRNLKTDQTTTIFNKINVGKITAIHKLGFERIGRYGFSFPNVPAEDLRLEIGLKGKGLLKLADPKLMSVSAIESLYRGRSIIQEKDWLALAPENRPSDVIVRPDNMWSLPGVKFLFKAYIPVEEWGQPALAWGGFIGLLCLATLSIALIMRKQWADSERFPFPNAKITTTLLGIDDEKEGAFPSIFQNRWMWMGFGIALIWGLLKGWSFYNADVPDTSITIPLKPLFQDPALASMFSGVTLQVSILLISVAIFFELNVLLSLIVGFFIFRSFYWVGDVTDIKVMGGFPWRYQQTVGAYLGTFAAVIFFTRRWFGKVLSSVIKGQAADHGEIVSYRVALSLLLLSFVGAGVWSAWVGITIGSVLTYFSFLVLIGFVTSKFRAECGFSAGYFSPYNAMVFVSILGGMGAFGPAGMLFALICSGFLTVTVFFLIPGAQLELVHFGRQLNIKPSHILFTAALGLAGGLFIGGWVFLSNAYALGGENIKYQWAFNQSWFFGSYKTELAKTTAEMLREPTEGVAAPADWGARTVAITASISVVLTILRQLFSGFWFHPIGFVLSSTHMVEMTWGSILFAWIIRSLVLKFGGATAVRNRLQPFFVGAFIGAVICALLLHTYGAYAIEQGATMVYGELP